MVLLCQWRLQLQLLVEPGLACACLTVCISMASSQERACPILLQAEMRESGVALLTSISCAATS